MKLEGAICMEVQMMKRIIVYNLTFKFFNNIGKACKLSICQHFHIINQFIQYYWIMVFRIKKIFRGNVKIFTDVKENLHGRKGFSIFDFINVTFTLP